MWFTWGAYGATQMPALELIGSEAKLVWEEPDDEEVVLARDSYAALRHHLRSLQGEVVQLCTHACMYVVAGCQRCSNMCVSCS
jgi:hypothetical protein